MAVKVFCQICETFIKDVENYDFQKLTGKELCVDCGKRVKDSFDVLEKAIENFKKTLGKEHARMTTQYKALDGVYKKYTENIQSLYVTTNAELKRRMEDILT